MPSMSKFQKNLCDKKIIGTKPTATTTSSQGSGSYSGSTADGAYGMNEILAQSYSNPHGELVLEDQMLNSPPQFHVPELLDLMMAPNDPQAPFTGSGSYPGSTADGANGMNEILAQSYSNPHGELDLEGLLNIIAEEDRNAGETSSSNDPDITSYDQVGNVSAQPVGSQSLSVILPQIVGGDQGSYHKTKGKDGSDLYEFARGKKVGIQVSQSVVTGECFVAFVKINPSSYKETICMPGDSDKPVFSISTEKIPNGKLIKNKSPIFGDILGFWIPLANEKQLFLKCEITSKQADAGKEFSLSGWQLLCCFKAYDDWDWNFDEAIEKSRESNICFKVMVVLRKRKADSQDDFKIAQKDIVKKVKMMNANQLQKLDGVIDHIFAENRT